MSIDIEERKEQLKNEIAELVQQREVLAFQKGMVAGMFISLIVAIIVTAL